YLLAHRARRNAVHLPVHPPRHRQHHPRSCDPDAIGSGRRDGGLVRWRELLGQLVSRHASDGQPADQGELVVWRHFPRIVLPARARIVSQPRAQVRARSGLSEYASDRAAGEHRASRWGKSRNSTFTRTNDGRAERKLVVSAGAGEDRTGTEKAVADVTEGRERPGLLLLE